MITKQTLFDEAQADGVEYDPNACGHGDAENAVSDYYESKNILTAIAALGTEIQRLHGTVEHQRRRAEIAEMSLEMIEADNRNLEDAHKRISELEREREEAVTDSEFATLENIKLRERIKELETQIAGLLPAAQAVVSKIEFVPLRDEPKGTTV